MGGVRSPRGGACSRRTRSWFLSIVVFIGGAGSRACAGRRCAGEVGVLTWVGTWECMCTGVPSVLVVWLGTVRGSLASYAVDSGRGVVLYRDEGGVRGRVFDRFPGQGAIAGVDECGERGRVRRAWA
jgi:hypothetical protein